uniref:Putative dirigent protein 17-like n=1 Tax=Davidia involucrata TaxID=16924 RepID=A0A5B7B293_DAVIN
MEMCKEAESESSSGVFELSGEPAIVINGVPPLSPTDGTLVLCDVVSDLESYRNLGFGEWLEGREVQKLFGEQFYNGKVIEFDKETGWYRVVYEDGDFEDLEWHELEEVLLPLDITVPLKALALKIIRKRQGPIHRYGKTVARSRNYQTKYARGKGKTGGACRSFINEVQ